MAGIENIEELRVFVQVVDSGSIVGASRALGLPANTVGRRLAALEARLDRTLISRTTRSQSLSEAGTVLLEQARRILASVDVVDHLLEEDRTEIAGLVRISVMSALAHQFFDALRALVRRHERLQLQVRVIDRLVDPNAAGADVVITAGRLTDSNLIVRKLFDAHVVLAASREYLEQMGTPEHPEDLKHHYTVPLISESPTTEWTLQAADGSATSVELTSRVSVDGSRTLIDALSAGLGIAPTSTRVLKRRPDLCRVLPGYSLGTYPLHAIYPHSGPRSRRLNATVAALETALRETDERDERG
ncbi:MAG: LysR family transcriptional regulator [Myxococcota bacterium]